MLTKLTKEIISWYISIMLYTLNLYSAVYQMHRNKNGKNKNKINNFNLKIKKKI